jgi:hypothetical protein
MISKEEYEEKLAALDRLYAQDMDHSDPVQRVWWVDQVRALTYATRPNVARVHRAVRTHEPELTVFWHFTSICAARSAWLGDDDQALMLVHACSAMRDYYETLIDPIPTERFRGGLRDAGVEQHEGRLVPEVVLDFKAMIERGWAAMHLLLDVGAQSLKTATLEALTDKAFAEIMVSALWVQMEIDEERIPRKGDPNYEYEEGVAELAETPLTSVDNAWDQLEQLLEANDILMTEIPMDEEDDEDE